MRALLIAGCCAGLAACAATPTVYGPATGPRAVGYSEHRIEPGRYRITFRGGPGAPAAQVADYALLRAADLAIAEGYDWFRVFDRSMAQVGPDSRPRIGLGVGGFDVGRRSAVGVGVSTSGIPIGPGGVPLAQTLEVLMGKGPPPRGDDVYDPREVRRSIGARARGSADG